MAEQRHRSRVTTKRRDVVGDPAQRGDDVEQGVVARRVAVSGRQEPYSNEHMSFRRLLAAAGRQLFFCDE